MAGTTAQAEVGRLGELYRAHAPDALRLAYLVTGNAAVAEDLVQEAFVRLYGRFRDLRNPGAFPWYLRRTVVNLARSHFRRERVARAYVRREGAMPWAGGGDPAQGADRDEMWRALLELPERQRTAIVLRYYEDLTEAQTAEVMGCPVGTVKSLVFRGLARLRVGLSSEVS
ncbi:MAG: SigE family RNA polymerase sigma factor [Actinobacteria bacterium]|nr:SigE family RNA polymerase sigma factor [Actinomycetota bacterium]